jgi:hypothetical protein
MLRDDDDATSSDMRLSTEIVGAAIRSLMTSTHPDHSRRVVRARRQPTVRQRTALDWFAAPKTRDDWLRLLMQCVSQLLQEQPLLADEFGPV